MTWWTQLLPQLVLLLLLLGLTLLLPRLGLFLPQISLLQLQPSQPLHAAAPVTSAPVPAKPAVVRVGFALRRGPSHREEAPIPEILTAPPYLPWETWEEPEAAE